MSPRLKRMLLLPAGAVLAYFAARVFLSVDADEAVNKTFNVAAFTLASGGCLLVGRAFQPGDYLRVAWHLQTASSLLLAISSVLRNLEPAETMLLARAGLTFISNLCAVLGAIVFARAHRVAGLSLPWSRPARVAFGAAVALAALAAVGPTIVILVPPALRGDLGSWIGVFSSIGDFVFLMLIAPIFMTALALRGGLLTWPWALLTASTVAWLLYDAQDSVVYFFPVLENADRTIVTVPLRILACTLLFAAAMAQRRLTSGAIDRSGA